MIIKVCITQVQRWYSLFSLILEIFLSFALINMWLCLEPFTKMGNSEP